MFHQRFGNSRLITRIVKCAVLPMSLYKLLPLALLVTAAYGDGISIHGTDFYEGTFLDVQTSSLVYQGGGAVDIRGSAGSIPVPDVFCFDPCTMRLATGPLISTSESTNVISGLTETVKTFTYSAAGSNISEGGITGGSVPLGGDPSLCPNLFGNGPCPIYDYVTGYFSGSITMTSMSNSASISGPVVFNVPDDYAASLEIQPGYYSGQFTVDASYLFNETDFLLTLDPASLGNLYQVHTGEEFLKGTSVPEPASWILLFTVVLAGAVWRLRPKRFC